ncbi:MAG: molybdopterin oxidoreductase family protein, partial [Acidiferrobacter sp.]
GSDTSTAISNLLLVTGNYGKKGSGAYPLRGHNNVQGAGDFGALAEMLPGYLKVSDPKAREHVSRAWGVEIPARPGLNNHSMIDAAHAGDLKAMYIIGEDTAVVDADTYHTQRALAKLDFLVVQDIFMSTTAQFADVVLPACPSLEKEGTFVNTERRIQRFERALDPLGESKPDWLILCELAKRFGHRWDYAGPREIMSEASKVAPILAGVTYDRLEGYNSLVWPVDAQGHSEMLLYTESFHTEDGRAKLHPVHWHAPVERACAEYDLTLNNGRVLEHFQEGNLTSRVPGIVSKVNQFYVEVSPELADELGIKTGACVTLTSRRGSVEARVLVSPRVIGRELYTVEFSLKEPINRLTGKHTDAATQTPAFKELTVKLKVLTREGPSPVPRSNPRFGTRTPQSGVEVERKWKRDEYRPIPGTVAARAGDPS